MKKNLDSEMIFCLTYAGPGQSRAVYNLEGSIFKWANEGRAMVDAAEQPTKLCHPYNFIFGKLLNKELRSKDVASPDCS